MSFLRASEWEQQYAKRLHPFTYTVDKVGTYFKVNDDKGKDLWDSLSADELLQYVIDLARVTGATIFLKKASYDHCGLDIAGNATDWDAKEIAIIGESLMATSIEADPDSGGVPAITLRNQSKVYFENFQIWGSRSTGLYGDAFNTTDYCTVFSRFKNMYFGTWTDGAEDSWAVDLEAPDFCTFENLMVKHMNAKGGMRFRNFGAATYAYGNTTFLGETFISLQGDNSVALCFLGENGKYLEDFRQYGKIISIPALGGSQTNCTGLKATNLLHSEFECLHFEQQNTNVNLINSSHNKIKCLTYTVPKAGGTIFKSDANCFGNFFEKMRFPASFGNNWTVIDEAEGAFNIYNDWVTGAQTGTTTVNLSHKSVIERWHGDWLLTGKKTNPFDNTNYKIELFGANASPVASQDYEICHTDILISSSNSGDSNCAIVIKDAAGNQVYPLSGTVTTLAGIFVKRSWKINWGGFTGTAPTVLVVFI